MKPKLVIGAPVWNRSWCLSTWFDCVEANCEPRETGLIFVVPPTDTQSRDVIADRARGYGFVEVLRDRNEQYDRQARRRDNHASLAQARNALLTHVSQVGPEHYLSWDSDLLVWPETVQYLMGTPYDLVTVWTWLNRRPAQRGQHWDEESHTFVPVEWNEPFNGTAMQWDKKRPGTAVHLDPRRWDVHTSGIWPCDVALAWQLMTPRVYSACRYGPHPHGEDLPFNYAVAQRGIQAYCCGACPGLHLFHRPTAEREIQLGYPGIMELSRTDLPLAATRPEPRQKNLRVIGFYEALEAA